MPPDEGAGSTANVGYALKKLSGNIKTFSSSGVDNVGPFEILPPEAEAVG